MSTDSRRQALEAGNELFHDSYGRARDGIKDQVPVLVLTPTELALHRGDQRRGIPYSCPAFARAKSAAHIAVALFALTRPDTTPEQRRAGVTRLLAHLAAAVAEKHADPGMLDREIEALLERCQRFAEAVNGQDWSAPLREQFASDAGTRILHITELATREQIAGLHRAVETAFSQLSASEQRELQVVVVGDHQARSSSLGMQYFKRRLQEPPGTDQRVTYGENIESEEEAISLVATRRFDKQIARAFFGDENRLQRDVLGDAAKHCLDEQYADLGRAGG